jgi:hypothetical protein
MISVREYRQRERAPAMRYAYMTIERDIRRVEWPRHGRAKLGKRRYVDTAGYV